MTELTFNDVMDELWPGSSPEAKDELLWTSPFPFASGDVVVEALKAMRDKYGPNIGDAINGEMTEFDRQVQDLKARGEWPADEPN